MSDTMWVNIVTQSTTVPDSIDSTFNPSANIPFMVAHNWRRLDPETRPVVPAGSVLVSSSFVQHPDFIDWAIEVLVTETDAEHAARIAADEQTWQDAKSPILKAIENIYVSFLATEWTPALIAKEIIAPDQVITVENTDSATNVYYLMALRQKDTDPVKTTYNYYAGEFQRLKDNIEGLGGIMSKVKLHV